MYLFNFVPYLHNFFLVQNWSLNLDKFILSCLPFALSVCSTGNNKKWKLWYYRLVSHYVTTGVNVYFTFLQNFTNISSLISKIIFSHSVIIFMISDRGFKVNIIIISYFLINILIIKWYYHHRRAPLHLWVTDNFRCSIFVMVIFCLVRA